jgi:hypothetical protein
LQAAEWAPRNVWNALLATDPDARVWIAALGLKRSPAAIEACSGVFPDPAPLAP